MTVRCRVTCDIPGCASTLDLPLTAVHELDEALRTRGWTVRNDAFQQVCPVTHPGVKDSTKVTGGTVRSLVIEPARR